MEINPSSPYLPSNKVNEYTSLIKKTISYRIWKKKLERLGKLSNNSKFKLLEIGCGRGYFLRCVQTWFPNAEVYGIDMEQSLLDFAVHQAKRATLIKHESQTLPFPDTTFDIVSSFQVVEHLKEPETFFQEAHRILKRNGLLLFSTPNPSGISAKALGNKWQGYRYDHISLKAPLQWKTLLKNYGFKILSDGTTGLTGFKILQIFPLALIN